MVEGSGRLGAPGRSHPNKGLAPVIPDSDSGVTLRVGSVTVSWFQNRVGSGDVTVGTTVAPWGSGNLKVPSFPTTSSTVLGRSVLDSSGDLTLILFVYVCFQSPSFLK